MGKVAYQIIEHPLRGLGCHGIQQIYPDIITANEVKRSMTIFSINEVNEKVSWYITIEKLLEAQNEHFENSNKLDIPGTGSEIGNFVFWKKEDYEDYIKRINAKSIKEHGECLFIKDPLYPGTKSSLSESFGVTFYEINKRLYLEVRRSGLDEVHAMFEFLLMFIERKCYMDSTLAYYIYPNQLL